MNLKYLTMSQENGVVTITINRPNKRNALNPDLLTEISSIFESVHVDATNKVVLLTGGEKFFSAGFDLNEIRKIEKNDNEAFTSLFHRAYRAILFCKLPVICAVGGPAIAGGFDLTLMCDVRYASDNAKFGQREIALALTPVLDPLWRIIGLGRAKELTLSGRIYDATEALSMGYVSQVFPQGELMTNVLDIATKMATFDREALVTTKKLSNHVLSQDLDSNMTAQEWLFRSFIGSTENHMRIDSLLEVLTKAKK